MPVITETRTQANGRTTIRPGNKLLLSRREAAALLSISQRSLDYLIAGNILPVRRIGARVLIPSEVLERFARTDHRRRIAL